MSDKDLEITKGWKYLVKMIDNGTAVGAFAGYSMIGSESAIVLEMDDKKLRFIPSTQIAYLDLLESKEKKDASKKGSDVYYG